MRILTATVLTGLCAVSQAHAEVLWEPSFESAVATSQESHKPILIEVSASWCGYCKKMERETFAHESVSRKINDCYVPVALDADRDDKIVDTLDIKVLPTTLIYSHEGELVQSIVGYRTAPQMARLLQNGTALK